MHLLSGEVDAAALAANARSAAPVMTGSDTRALEERVAALEASVAALQQQLEQLQTRLA